MGEWGMPIPAQWLQLLGLPADRPAYEQRVNSRRAHRDPRAAISTPERRGSGPGDRSVAGSRRLTRGAPIGTEQILFILANARGKTVTYLEGPRDWLPILP
jgi:hypothetical protein